MTGTDGKVVVFEVLSVSLLAKCGSGFIADR